MAAQARVDRCRSCSEMRPRALITTALASIAIVATLSGCGSSAVVAGPLARAAYVTGHVERRPHAAERPDRSGRASTAGLDERRGLLQLRLPRRLALDPADGPSGNRASARRRRCRRSSRARTCMSAPPLFTGKLPGGASWIKVDLTKVEQAAGLDPSQLLQGQANPAQFLEYLKASGSSVTIVGHEPRTRRAHHPLRRRDRPRASSPPRWRERTAPPSRRRSRRSA